jgi:hypothetical protein
VPEGNNRFPETLSPELDAGQVVPFFSHYGTANPVPEHDTKAINEYL